MSRLPVRVRVTLAFAGVMAVVLGATGLFVYARMRAELDVTIEQGLRSRAALIRSGTGLEQSDSSPLTERGDDSDMDRRLGREDEPGAAADQDGIPAGGQGQDQPGHGRRVRDHPRTRGPARHPRRRAVARA